MSERKGPGALVPVLLLFSHLARAAPTAGELIKTCETALEHDYKTVEAAMCDWYVAPCGACGKEGPPAPQWCLPPELTGAALATHVVALLKAEPARAEEPAPAAVKAVLQARHPCAAPSAGR